MAATTEVKEAKQGRPRDPHVDAAIRRAALDVLVEDGFARMSIEGVANRAGVGKAAIYRRWDNKTALVLEAIHDLMAPHIQEWPQTDDIRADLEVILRQFLHKIRGVEGELMKAVASEMVRYPEVAAMMREQFVDCNKQILQDRIRQAQADGVLAPGDAELQGECGFAIIFHRALLSGSPLSDDLPKRLVDQFFPAGPAAAHKG